MTVMTVAKAPPNSVTVCSIGPPARRFARPPAAATAAVPRPVVVDSPTGILGGGAADGVVCIHLSKHTWRRVGRSCFRVGAETAPPASRRGARTHHRFHDER